MFNRHSLTRVSVVLALSISLMLPPLSRSLTAASFGIFVIQSGYGGSGFGGLGEACWALLPKFAGSNPAEAVGYLQRKNPQYAFLRRGSKAAGLMS